MKEKVYNPAADIIRILAGIGVVLIHVTDPFITYPPYFGIGGSSWWIINLINTIFRVSVPLFIVLSGYLLLSDLSKKLDFKQFYKRRFARVGLPALFWIVFYFIWLYMFDSLFFLGAIPKKILTVDLEHLYFIIIILELYFVTPLFHTFLREASPTSRKVLLLSAATFTLVYGLVGWLYPKGQVTLSRNIATIFIPYIFYFLIGPTLGKINIKLSKVLSLSIVYFYLVVFVAIISSGIVESYFRQYPSFTIMAMTLISFVALFQLNKWSLIRDNKTVRKTIQYIASLIFGVYLVHMMVIFALNKYIYLIPGNIPSPFWIYVLLKVAIVTLISFAIVAIGKKIPYIRYLFP